LRSLWRGVIDPDLAHLARGVPGHVNDTRHQGMFAIADDARINTLGCRRAQGAGPQVNPGAIDVVTHGDVIEDPRSRHVNRDAPYTTADIVS